MLMTWGKMSINVCFEDSRICTSAIDVYLFDNNKGRYSLRKINRDRKGDKKWVKK